jgi:hypothetical protein
MLTSVLIVLLLIVLGIVIYLATLEGKYTIRVTQLINAEVETVIDKLKDFKSWAEWSPWIIHEPDTKLEFSEHYNREGSYYTWDGHDVGAGN